LPRPRRLREPRHWRAVRDPAAAERQRELGEGGAAGAGADRVRSRPGHLSVARRHERHRRHRYRAAAHLRFAVRREPERRAGNASSDAASPQGRAAVTAGAIPAAGMRRTMVTVCAMSATIMQALDTTIANVALPYMQGSLSASLDQINWVLTSYIVASAIMTAPI